MFSYRYSSCSRELFGIFILIALASCSSGEDIDPTSDGLLKNPGMPPSEEGLSNLYSLGGTSIQNTTGSEDDPPDDAPYNPTNHNGSGGGGYGFHGKAAAATFDSVQPAICAPKPTTVFAAGKAVASVSASTTKVKGKITFSTVVPGIQPSFVINGLAAGTNGPGPFSVLSVSSTTTQTAVTVSETTKSFSGSGTANIYYGTEQLIPDCNSAGINPLYIRGRGFPRSDQAGVSLKMDLIAENGQPACELFSLGGTRYRYVDSSNAMWDVPAYRSTWQQCDGTTFPSFCSDGSLRCDCNGQVAPTMGGCQGSIEGRSVSLSIGAQDQYFSSAANAFTYGVKQAVGVKPEIDYVCVTPILDWNAGNISSDCIPSGNGSGSTNGDIRAHTGDVLTIVGRNFERLNAPPICPSSNPNCARKRIRMNLDISVGGVPVNRSVDYLFSLVNSLDKNDPRNGECVYDAASGGGTCQRVHSIIPPIPAQKIPVFVGATVRNATKDRDEYGGSPALGVSGDPGERKIKYYGGTVTVDTLPPPPVRVMQAVARGQDTIDVSFEEVGDDPFNYQNANLPVNHYILKMASMPITSQVAFQSAVSYSGFLAGHDPVAADSDGHVPPWQTASFSGLTPGQTYCFSAKAVDQTGLVSALRVPAGDGGPDGVFCAIIPVVPVDRPPCPIALAAEPGDIPTTQVRLNWVEVGQDSDTVSGMCVSRGGKISSLELKYRPGTVDFAEGEFVQGAGFTAVPVTPLDPGLVNQKLIAVLSQPSTLAQPFIFAIRAIDSSGNTSFSNRVVFSTQAVQAPRYGNGTFVNLSLNLPATTNVENSIQILPDMAGGHPWILLADPSAGLQILKVADAYNVSCLQNPSDPLSVDPACSLGIDILPRDTQNPPRWVGDGQPDFLDRDRHIFRTGLADCDGNNAITQSSPSTADWSKVDSFARCNLPAHPVYQENIRKASMVAVGRVNSDPFDDIVIANLSASGVPDAVYVNSGQDLCPTRPGGGMDVADGIPCFQSPIAMPKQLGSTKLPSSRVRLYSANSGSGGADLIFMMTGKQEVGGFSIYSNGCKNRPGPCDPADFALQTNLIDIGGNTALSPLYCEDVAFVHLDGDNIKDMICVRSESFSSPNNHGVNLTFRAIDPATTLDGLPHFVLAQNLLSAATTNNCNHSFAESVQSGNGSNYLLVGYRKLGGNVAGAGTSCKTRLYTGSNGNLSEVLLPGMDNQDNCHNGALADSSGRSRIDVALACGQLEDLSADFGGDPQFRGMRLFRNNGSNSFTDFEAGGLALFEPQIADINTGRPTVPLVPGSSLIFDDVNVPGAASAVGIGDLNGDGVPDTYFGNGATAVGGSAWDMVFRQMGSP